jgi:hypothetical protein
MKSCSRTHQRHHGLGILHFELPHYVLGVLGLVHKCSLPQLFDLEVQEELQLTHHADLEFPAHVLCKPCNQRVRQATKDNIIHVHLSNQNINTLPEEKQRLIYIPYLKALSK